MARHRIVEADEKTRKGNCSECGPTKVYRNAGTKGFSWRCASQAKSYINSRLHDDPSVARAHTNARLLRLYGITIEQYEEMLVEQDGKCARCSKSIADGDRRLAVDHCHNTGAVRKLLCGPCNTYLGRLATNRDQLERDLAYLDSGVFAAVIAQNI